MDFRNEQVHFPREQSSEYQSNPLLRRQPSVNYCFPAPLDQAWRYHTSSHLPSHTANELFHAPNETLYQSLPGCVATGTVDSTVVSNPHQVGWNGSSSSLARAIHPPLLPFHDQYESPYSPHLCGYNQSLDDPHVAPTQAIPQLYSTTFQHLHSYAGECDEWVKDSLAGNTDPQTPLDRDEYFATLLCLLDSIATEPCNGGQTLITPPAISEAAVDSAGPVGSRPDSLCGNATSVKLKPKPKFLCQWITADGLLCAAQVVADRRRVVEHLHTYHGIQSGNEKARVRCSWFQCTKDLNKESLPRHILTVHVKDRVYCTQCGLQFAREDSLKRHLKGAQHDGCPQADKNSRKSALSGMRADRAADGGRQS